MIPGVRQSSRLSRLHDDFGDYREVEIPESAESVTLAWASVTNDP